MAHRKEALSYVPCRATPGPPSLDTALAHKIAKLAVSWSAGHRCSLFGPPPTEQAQAAPMEAAVLPGAKSSIARRGEGSEANHSPVAATHSTPFPPSLPWNQAA